MSALDVDDATRRARIAETIAMQSEAAGRPAPRSWSLWRSHNAYAASHDELVSAHNSLLGAHNQIVAQVSGELRRLRREVEDLQADRDAHWDAIVTLAEVIDAMAEAAGLDVPRMLVPVPPELDFLDPDARLRWSLGARSRRARRSTTRGRGAAPTLSRRPRR